MAAFCDFQRVYFTMSRYIYSTETLIVKIPSFFYKKDKTAFRAEQLKVAIPGWLRESKRWAVSRGTIDIKKKGKMSCK
jgi:hypothetical protein